MRRRIIIFLTLSVILMTLVFLYERQLGAVSFFLLAIFFFTLAFDQLSDPSKKKRKQKMKQKSP
ncbi:hypothetical protein PZE06_08605 [Robertmurraya sp. DFI.2.37]|uniref:hypothetical protein n=1 Tax=Robertmurraya sp. DFI.2.37 TaxID=3031819 RepID=UPI0012452A89|nr:hypothetical protein [Robertmurraya sp. DFI.2.37]MDF1508245.1 hypothetical protein [Robertmurraya sp. DFI.2.37]